MSSKRKQNDDISCKVRYIRIDMVKKAVHKKVEAKAKKAKTAVDFEPAKIGFLVAVVAAVSIVLFAIIGTYGSYGG